MVLIVKPGWIREDQTFDSSTSQPTMEFHRIYLVLSLSPTDFKGEPIKKHDGPSVSPTLPAPSPYIPQSTHWLPSWSGQNDWWIPQSCSQRAISFILAWWLWFLHSLSCFPPLPIKPLNTSHSNVFKTLTQTCLIKNITKRLESQSHW